MTTVRRARRARRAVAAAAVAGTALVAAGCNLGEPPVRYPGPSAEMEAADLDGDGDLDLVAVEAPPRGEQSASRVLLNDGDGGFTSSGLTPEGVRGVVDVALGDLDGDGDVDRVDLWPEYPDVQFSSGTIALHRGDGDGGFAPAEEVVSDEVNYPSQLQLVDMDDDGALDVVTAHGSGNYDQVGVRLGDGDGGLGGWVVNIHVPVEQPWLRVGDLDGDGAEDVLLVGRDGTAPGVGAYAWSVLLGDGEGGLGAPTAPVPVHAPGEVNDLGAVELADVDEDGNLDLVGVNRYADRTVLWSAGDGDGGFAAPVRSPGGGARDVAVADIDGDGNLDLVTAGVAGTGGEVHYGAGDGTFGDTHMLAGGGDTPANQVLTLPLDADGRVDVVYGRGAWDAPSDISVLMNTREGRNHG